MATAFQQKILDEWEIDCKIDKAHLDESLAHTPNLHQKYLRFLAETNNLIRSNKSKLEKMKKTKRLYFEGKLSKSKMDDLGWDYDPYDGGKKAMKSEIGMWLDADDDVLTVKGKLDELETARELLKEILSQIQWRTQTLKTILESRKFEAGF